MNASLNLDAKRFDNEANGIVTSAKSLAGGFPLAAVVGRAKIMDAPEPGGIGGTYAGNPVACAAALGVFDAFEQEGLLEKAEKQGQIIMERKDQAVIIVDLGGGYGGGASNGERDDGFGYCIHGYSDRQRH